MNCIILSHKIALDPTDAQITHFKKACGVARFAYNWGLAQWNEQYKVGLTPTAFKLDKHLNSIKRSQFPWMYDVTKCAAQKSILNLGSAFQRFFAKLAKHPKFKKKGNHDSFYISNTSVKVTNKTIKIPLLKPIRMREALRFKGKIMSAVISRTADRWFVSIAVEIEHEPPIRKNQAVAGVDLGVSAFATLSDGSDPILAPKPLKKMLNKLQRLSRDVSRKIKGSQNRAKARMKLARFHARIANVRKDFLHKLTTRLVKSYTRIGIEDLNVRGMTQNRRLSRSISDLGFFEFRRQLEYKAKLYGSMIVVADCFFPSSKLCSSCGFKLDNLPLSVRSWTCPGCQTSHDRDRNAAINLRNLAARSAVIACGEVSSGSVRKRGTKLTFVKQELSTSVSAE